MKRIFFPILFCVFSLITNAQTNMQLEFPKGQSIVQSIDLGENGFVLLTSDAETPNFLFNDRYTPPTYKGKISDCTVSRYDKNFNLLWRKDLFGVCWSSIVSSADGKYIYLFETKDVTHYKITQFNESGVANIKEITERVDKEVEILARTKSAFFCVNNDFMFTTYFNKPEGGYERVINCFNHKDLSYSVIKSTKPTYTTSLQLLYLGYNAEGMYFADKNHVPGYVNYAAAKYDLNGKFLNDISFNLELSGDKFPVGSFFLVDNPYFSQQINQISSTTSEFTHSTGKTVSVNATAFSKEAFGNLVYDNKNNCFYLYGLFTEGEGRNAKTGFYVQKCNLSGELIWKSEEYLTWSTGENRFINKMTAVNLELLEKDEVKFNILESKAMYAYILNGSGKLKTNHNINSNCANYQTPNGIWKVMKEPGSNSSLTEFITYLDPDNFYFQNSNTIYILQPLKKNIYQIKSFNK